MVLQQIIFVCYNFICMSMSIDLFFRLEYVDYLIRAKSTGKPKEFAERLDLSERSLYDLIHLMKNLGAPIAYCKQKKTYYYTEQGKLNLHFQIEKDNVGVSSQPFNYLNKAVVLFLCVLDLFMETDLIFGVI